jgi:hypothetical protein
MGMRAVPRGDAPPAHAEAMALAVLRGFAVEDAERIANLPLPLPHLPWAG